MKWLHKFQSRLIGFSFLFVYWDKKAEVLEFNIFNKPFSFWIKPEGESIWDKVKRDDAYMEIRTGHKKSCLWATPLPNEFTPSGFPCFWGCNCGYDEWYLNNEEVLDKEVLIVDRIEHGNGGVCGTKVLDTLSLKDAFSKSPSDYGISWSSKVFGFYPVINTKDSCNDYLYYWDEDDECWANKA